MNKLLRVIKVSIDTLMAIIIIVGAIFLVLYIAGIKPFVVQTASMEPAIHVGSVSFINKNIKFEDIKENDVIAFKIQNDKQVTHRAVSINGEEILTKGDANAIVDSAPVTKKNYLGKNIFSIPKVGYAVTKIQTKRGKIVLGTVILMLVASAILVGDPKKKKDKNKDKEQNESKPEQS